MAHKTPTSQGNKPNYALRRTIVFGGLILVIALFIWGISSVISAITGSSEVDVPQSQTVPTEKTVDGIVEADGSVTIPECTPAHLSVTVDGMTVDVGTPIQIPYSVTNSSDTACRTAAGRFTHAITSGDELYFDSAQCAGSDPDDTPLLLAAGAQWESSFTWDAGIYNGCSPVDANNDGKTDIADAGTYVLDIGINGAKGQGIAVINVR